MKTFTYFKILFFFAATLIFSVNANSQAVKPIGCNGQYYVSYGQSSGSTTNTLMAKLAFSGSTITPSSFPLTPGNIGYNAMGLNPIDGFIYAIRYPANSSISHLVKIDSLGNESDLGAIAGTGLSANDLIYSGCFDANGDFYFTDNTSGGFFKITNNNFATRTATLITTNSAFKTIYDIAISPVNENMYGTSSSTSTNYLIKINKTTGAASSGVGSTNMGGAGFFAAVFINETGNLFGYRSDGKFFLIDTASGTLTAAGTGTNYSGADGASCSFGRVFHTMAASFNNQVCPTASNQHPVDTLTIAVTNQTSVQQTGLTYTLNLPDNRFSFNQSADTILKYLKLAGVLPSSATTSNINISSISPGTNNNLVVSSFQTGAINTTLTFKLQIQLVILGGTYAPVPLQSVITGLPANLGGTDLSDDPSTVTPNDPTTLSFCQGITLPVNLLSFSGIYKNNATQLNWEADNQVNFSGYDLERSTDGVTFNSIVFVPNQASGSATQSYQYIDDLSSLNENVFYYRLKMVDLDGKFSYSNIIMVRKDQQTINGISIIPNPVINDMATVRFTALTSGLAEVRIINLTGQVVLRQQNNMYEGTNSISVNNLSHLQPGIYMIQVANGNNLISNKFSLVK